MRKYLPGGRCGGSVMESCKKEDTQGINTSLNALLAQRDAQIAQLFQPQPQQTPLTQQQQTQIVLVEQKKQPSKEQIINTILDGDY